MGIHAWPTLFGLLLFAAPLAAQLPDLTKWQALAAAAPPRITAHFSPQDTRLAGLVEWSVLVCAPNNPALATVQGAQIYAAAHTHLARATHAKVQATFDAQKRRSPWRVIGSIIKYLLLGFATADAAELVEVREKRYRTGAVALGLALQMLDAAVKAEAPVEELPANMVQPYNTIPAGGCVELAMFSRATDIPPIPFDVLVTQ